MISRQEKSETSRISHSSRISLQTFPYRVIYYSRHISRVEKKEWNVWKGLINKFRFRFKYIDQMISDCKESFLWEPSTNAVISKYANKFNDPSTVAKPSVCDIHASQIFQIMLLSIHSFAFPALEVATEYIKVNKKIRNLLHFFCDDTPPLSQCRAIKASRFCFETKIISRVLITIKLLERAWHFGCDGGGSVTTSWYLIVIEFELSRIFLVVNEIRRFLFEEKGFPATTLPKKCQNEKNIFFMLKES